MTMTVGEYIRLVAKIAVLKEVVEEYPARPLRTSSYKWRQGEKNL